jgi:membrane-associated protease RseP (regulator of RpoE activity)
VRAPGDERIVSIDGVAIDTWEQSTGIIREHPNEALTMVVVRDGEETTLTVTPALSERYVVDDDGQVVTDASGDPVTVEAGFVGIGAASERVSQPVTEVLPAMGDNITRVAGIILNLPQRMVDVANAAFGPGERDPNGPISVVGVGRVAGEIAAIDEIPVIDKAAGLIGILASLNIALFVFNMVPLLPLDGGHIAGALYEALRRGFARLRRRPDPGYVDVAKLLPIAYVVASAVLVMGVVLIVGDLVVPIHLQS